MTAPIDVRSPVFPFVLARRFSAVLREWLTEDELDDVIAANLDEPDPTVCHTRGQCDADLAMVVAYSKLIGTDPDDFESNADVASVFGAAWALARMSGFADGLPKQFAPPWWLVPSNDGSNDVGIATAGEDGEVVLIGEMFGDMGEAGGHHAVLLTFLAAVYPELVRALTAARGLLSQIHDHDPDDQSGADEVLATVDAALALVPPLSEDDDEEDDD